MSLLRLFMSIITSVKALVEYAQNLGADKAKLSQELASTQQQLATALANDKADADTIAAANLKYDELQASANADKDKAAQLEGTIAGLVKDDAEAEALIAAIVPQPQPQPEVVPDKVEALVVPTV
jgi:chromosome segregation ATPase